MSSSPEVSVVIVARRARGMVLGCLGSLEAHAGLAYEAIVVDDGSDDGTADAVRTAYPQAQVVEKPRSEGLASGRNSALPLVRAPRVLMLDADTEVTPGAMGAMTAVLDRDPAIGLVGPKLVHRDGEVQPSCRRWPSPAIPALRRWPLARIFPESRTHRHHMMLDFDHDSERPVVYVMGAAQMWRAELPELIGAYDESVSSYGGEDLDWCLRVWDAGMTVHYVPQATVIHDWQRVVHHSSPWDGDALRALRDFYYLQWKHRGLRRDPRLASL